MPEVTRLPRWCAKSVAGTGEEVVAVPDGVEQLAATLRVPPDAVLLAGYLCVVARVTGETSLTVGYRDAAGPTRALHVEVDDGTWRDLVLAAAACSAPADRPAPTAGAFDTVFGPDSTAALSVAPAGANLVVRYDGAAFDADQVARFGGYLTAALRAMRADPDARHRPVDLLSAAERRHQVDGLGGARRALPDARFHELFAARGAA